MGFCFVGHAALCARDLLARGAERVMIVDWDVHHGNGTQALVETDPRIRFVSLHQWPAYPGTGRAEERGCGNIWNLPLAPGFAPARYRDALWQGIEQAGEGWTPDALVISAGFDCLAGDPLGGFTLEPEDLGDITLRLRTRWPSAGIASLLEGGYRPDRLADGVMAHLRALGA
jgi:acetoin utilization deacetylase AcuC-like enzyme